MQVVGYELGSGAGKLLGEVATYVGLALLETIGWMMIRNSIRNRSKPEFGATRTWEAGGSLDARVTRQL
jgi:putative Mn2+ efflux pump MntP